MPRLVTAIDLYRHELESVSGTNGRSVVRRKSTDFSEDHVASIVRVEE
jgi:hypothetical protein